MHAASRLHVRQSTDGREQPRTVALPHMILNAHILAGTALVFVSNQKNDATLFCEFHVLLHICTWTMLCAFVTDDEP